MTQAALAGLAALSASRGAEEDDDDNPTGEPVERPDPDDENR